MDGIYHDIVRRFDLVEELRALLWTVNKEVVGLGSALRDVGYSIDLVHEADARRAKLSIDDDELSEKTRRLTRWQINGAHGAIAALNAYGDTLQQLRDLIVASAIDSSIGEDSWNDFVKKFPHWKSARHAAAHNHEIMREAHKNQVKGKIDNGLVKAPAGVGVVLMDSFRGDTFVTTRRGQLLEVRLNNLTVEKLSSHLDDLKTKLTAFYSANAGLQRWRPPILP